MSDLFVNSWYFYNNWVISCVLVNWFRTMAHNSRDHGYDVGEFFVVVLYFILLFLFFTYLAKPIFQETSTKINTKNCQCYCKKKSTTILLSTLLPTIEVKSKFSQLCSETTRLQLIFQHLDIISVQLSIRV